MMMIDWIIMLFIVFGIPILINLYVNKDPGWHTGEKQADPIDSIKGGLKFGFYFILVILVIMFLGDFSRGPMQPFD